MIKHKSLVYCEQCASIRTIDEIFEHTLRELYHLTHDERITKAKIQKFSNNFFSNYQLQKLFPKSRKKQLQQFNVS
ncbi:hypothetical protein ROU88_01435 [Macrococcus capreoli]|uniref:hypothetical protein n=1 Tax=Macrococcus capreoli TaxID=2982690 RepID=UPI0021D5A7B6|nr:hypothetical protein [Macrococcus sp. TMW 2.2395]MCU7557602.1 hypothetical protein [Macrococcus sp. TMW 2.2395]